MLSTNLCLTSRALFYLSTLPLPRPAPRQPPEQWRPQPQPTAVPVQQPYVGDLIYNRDEAWDYYQRFVKVGTEWHALYYFAAE